MIVGYILITNDMHSDEVSRIQSVLFNCGCEDIASDHVDSVTCQRPSFRNLLSTLGNADTLIFANLGGLGQSALHILQSIDLLVEAEIHFSVISPRIDTNTVGGMAIVDAFLGLLEFDRNATKNRANNASKSASNYPRRGGRPASITDDAKMELVRMVNLGLSPREAGSQLGISRSHAYRIVRQLRNP